MATQVLDKLSHTTEPGLSAYSFFIFIFEEVVFVSKKKILFIVSAVVLVVCAVLGFTYWSLFVKDNGVSEYDKLKQGMKAWENMAYDGVSVYVPEDYEETSNDYYNYYIKDGARIVLTSEEVENDLVNYVAYAISAYREITDGFLLKEEFEVVQLNTTVRVVEFDYTLALESGNKNISCMTAYILNNGRAYILTCTADTDVYQNYRDDFERTYKTFCITESNDENSKK